MSGDVQPRKRKDRKKKKDDLVLEEPKGTAAALGDGDVFLHSHHDHGTGGHWCAKIIFFSLLAVLITLIGLIILENRGLTELEANSVQTQYSGVLEGWLEDAPDDDHHDEHTLELNHPDEQDEREINYNNNESLEDENDDGEQIDKDNYEGNGDDEDEDNDEDEDTDNYDEDNDEDEDTDNYDEDSDVDDNDRDDDDDYVENSDVDDDNNNNGEDEDEDDADDYKENSDSRYNEDDGDDDDNEGDDDEDESAEQQKDDQDEEEHDDHDDEDEVEEELEVEHIVEEPSDLEPISTELPALPEEDDESQKNEQDDDDDDDDNNIADDDTDDNDEDDLEYLEPPVVEHVSTPSGKPYVEFEDSTEEVPVDTLAEEDEYEKRQEELRREEEESASHIWLKLGVGAALLAATHAVMRRATGRDTNDNTEENEEESTSVTDRRMTLIPQDEDETETETVQTATEVTKKDERKEKVKPIPILIQTIRPTMEDDEEEEEIETLIPGPIKLTNVESKREVKKVIEPEIDYSDEDIEEEDEKIIEIPNDDDANEDEDDVADDVEIIDDEHIVEEGEEDGAEEGEEEEISDVDDAELLSRLEAKYGRLPEPHRSEPKHKDGGRSVEDIWPDEPEDPYWREQLDQAEHQLHEDSVSSLTSAVSIARSAALRSSARARWVAARGVDRKAEILRDNLLLEDCIKAYLHLLDMNDRLSEKQLWMIANRTLDRMNFKGNYLRTEQVHRLLIKRFPEDPAYRNNLTIAFLMSNRADKAVVVLKETLKLWPEDRVALAHYGFVQKTLYNELEESVTLFQRALQGDEGPAVEPRFYYHLGDALLLLGRKEEAQKVHERGAALGMFLSATQRSLYNVDRLKSSPWWDIDKTPYRKLAESLEKSWKEILVEGEKARALYEAEKEGLRERGEWSQLDMFVRGREVSDRCNRAPVTCSLVRAEPAAAGCRRGQVKFSAMAAGTHVRAHVGPTNCRLRMHLALSNTEHTYLRVANETRQWQVGKVLMFDDSFEHEVWHNGTAPRLVLIVDVWHPDLTPAERRTLPAI